MEDFSSSLILIIHVVDDTLCMAISIIEKHPMFSRRNTFKRIVLVSPDVTMSSEATLSYKLQVGFLAPRQ